MTSARPFLIFFILLFISIPLVFSQGNNTQALLGKEQTYVDVPLTNVKFIPPAHFIYMEQNRGYMHVGTSSSVQVLEVKGTAYTMITPGLTADYFKSQGVTLIGSEDVTTKDGKKAKIFTVSFFVENVEFERLMFFTGDYNNTIWINANYPVAVKEMLNSVLKESLLTARFIQ